MKESAYKGKITKLFNTFSHVINELIDSGVLNNKQSRDQQIQIILDLKVHVRGVMIKEESGDWEIWSDLNEYANYVCNDLDKITDLVYDMVNDNKSIKRFCHFDYELQSYEMSHCHDLLALQTRLRVEARNYQNSK